MGNDIKMGGVVLSKSHESHGDVVQYDSGKRFEQYKIIRRGNLTKLSFSYLSVISELDARNLTEDIDLQKHISATFVRLQKMVLRSNSPGQSSGMLFVASYMHTPSEVVCVRCDFNKLNYHKLR